MKRLLLLLAALVLPITARAQSSQEINGSRTLPLGSSLRMKVANDSGTGTTVNLLAKLTSTGAIKATTADTTIPTFIVEAGAGTTGNAELVTAGHGNCIMDTTTSNTEGFYVVASTTTDGRCHAQSSAPTAFIVGAMVSNSTTSGSLAVVQSIQSFNIAGAGSGTVTSIATTSPIAGGTITTSGTITCPTCVTSAAAEANNALVLGSGGGQGTKTVAGIISDGVSALTLGVAGASVGAVNYTNATSGTITVQPVTGALGTITQSLPNSAGTFAVAATSPITLNATTGNVACATCGVTGSPLSQFAATTSAQFAGVISDEVGTGAVMLATGPTTVTLDAEGTGNVLTRPFYIEALAACNNATADQGSFDSPTASAATYTCFGTTTTLGAGDFVDAATTGNGFHFRLPVGWVGNIDVRLTWFANAASANAVRWSVATGCVADAAAVNTGPTYNTASATNAAYTGTANQQTTTTLTALSVTNCAAGNTAWIQIQRIGANGGDTLTATAELVSAQVEGRMTK